MLVLQQLIVFVLKTIVLVLMVPKLLEMLVLHIIPTFAPLVLVIFTKLVICAAHVLLVELEKEKQRLVLQELIVYVLKTYALVIRVLKQLELLVLHKVVTSARLAITVIILVVHRALPMVVRVAMG